MLSSIHVCNRPYRPISEARFLEIGTKWWSTLFVRSETIGNLDLQARTEKWMTEETNEAFAISVPSSECNAKLTLDWVWSKFASSKDRRNVRVDMT